MVHTETLGRKGALISVVLFTLLLLVGVPILALRLSEGSWGNVAFEGVGLLACVYMLRLSIQRARGAESDTKTPQRATVVSRQRGEWFFALPRVGKIILFGWLLVIAAMETPAIVLLFEGQIFLGSCVVIAGLAIGIWYGRILVRGAKRQLSLKE